MVESVLITGANRGIGLEFVRQFVSRDPPPKFVFATYRDESAIQELEDLKSSVTSCQLVLLKMDLCDPCAIYDARRTIESYVGDRGLQLLVNNAAVIGNDAFDNFTIDEMMRHIRTNVAGTLNVIKEMLPLLEVHATADPDAPFGLSRAAILTISSGGGSLTHATNKQEHMWTVFSYKISKAALNMSVRLLSNQLLESGVLVVLMCPGWVSGTGEPPEKIQLNREESVAEMLATLATLDESHQAAFVQRDGTAIPF